MGTCLDGPKKPPIYWRACTPKMSSRGFVAMRKLFSRQAIVALVAVLGAAQAGCNQIGVLKGQMALRDAVKYYTRQDYRQAAAKYEEALAANPGLGDAYFYLGNSYDNQYKPSRKGEPEDRKSVV